MLVVVMGVAGSGKTTVGQRLALMMECAFLDADSLHSDANVETPLTVVINWQSFLAKSVR